ncbi:hypothetical protein H6F61_14815 [Cyanobacteria bacterium FACHB-472]|nr:hypothetical protein [Cyanobacteria bacterium FACHB-472]
MVIYSAPETKALSAIALTHTLRDRTQGYIPFDRKFLLLWKETKIVNCTYPYFPGGK